MAVLLGQNGVHGIHDFRAAAVVQRDTEDHALVSGGSFHGVAHVVLHAFGKFVRAAQKPHADIVFLNQRHFPAQILAQQLHEKVDFRFWTPPVLDRERVERERLDLQARASFNRRARRLCAGAVARHAWQMPLLRPAPIAVHDDGHMPRQALQIKLFEEKRFLGCQRSQRAGGGNLQRRV